MWRTLTEPAAVTLSLAAPPAIAVTTGRRLQGATGRPTTPTDDSNTTPTDDPTFIPCTRNCPPAGTPAPQCSFFATCGNTCYCGSLPDASASTSIPPTQSPSLAPSGDAGLYSSFAASPSSRLVVAAGSGSPTETASNNPLKQTIVRASPQCTGTGFVTVSNACTGSSLDPWSCFTRVNRPHVEPAVVVPPPPKGSTTKTVAFTNGKFPNSNANKTVLTNVKVVVVPQNVRPGNVVRVWEGVVRDTAVLTPQRAAEQSVLIFSQDALVNNVVR